MLLATAYLVDDSELYDAKLTYTTNILYCRVIMKITSQRNHSGFINN